MLRMIFSSWKIAVNPFKWRVNSRDLLLQKIMTNFGTLWGEIFDNFPIKIPKGVFGKDVK